MTTEAFKNWLKTIVDSPSYTIGKLDTTKQNTICVYSGRSGIPNKPAVGNATGYGEKTLRLLVRWGKNYSIAEGKALEVYNAMGDSAVQIGDEICCIVRAHKEPVSLGSDDMGVYEFSIDVTLYYER